MAKLRDQHLAEYFSEDILKQLDEAEKNVLYDEFSNSELRLLSGQELDVVRGHAAKHLEAEFSRRFNAIKEDEYPLLKEWYLSVSNSVHEIICSKCGALLGIEIDTKDDSINPNHIEGKFVVAIGDKMFSYRPRLDGVMGYQCANVVDVTEDVKNEALAEREAAMKARRPKIEAEILERRKEEFKEQYDRNVRSFIDDEEFPKIKTEKQAAKMFMATPPTKENIQEAVDINLALEFPEPIFADKVYCGNDTRWSQIEIDNIPEDHIMTSLTESDIVKVKQEMNISNYEPDVQQTKKGYKVESFELREVKS